MTSPAAHHVYDLGMQPLPRPNASDPLQHELPDIREWPLARRHELRQGYFITVYTGQVIAMKLSTGLFKAVSNRHSLINWSDIMHPRIHLPAIPTAPFRHLEEWLRRVLDDVNIPILLRLDDTVKDLSIIRAGKMLGMDRYVQHITQHYMNIFEYEPLHPKDLDDVLRVATHPSNSMLCHLAKRMARDYCKNNCKCLGFGSWDEWEKFMEDRPLLQEAFNTAYADLDRSGRNGSSKMPTKGY